jgi:hypothetical protein
MLHLDVYYMNSANDLHSFVKRVTQSMSKIDPLLKTLQVRPSPPEALVQAYLIHIADKSDTNFRKILELKGIRKGEQTQLLDLFGAFRASPNHENLVQNSPFLTPLHIQTGHMGTGIGSLGNAGGVMSTMGTPNLGGGRFDPAGLGNMLVNAARDGVDRFGTPTPGTAGTVDTSVGDAAKALEGMKMEDDAVLLVRGPSRKADVRMISIQSRSYCTLPCTGARDQNIGINETEVTPRSEDM